MDVIPHARFDPPARVSRKSITELRVELVDRLQQSDRTLLGKIVDPSIVLRKARGGRVANSHVSRDDFVSGHYVSVTQPTPEKLNLLCGRKHGLRHSLTIGQHTKNLATKDTFAREEKHGTASSQRAHRDHHPGG